MLKEISAKELQENPFKLFNDDWGVITAGNEENYNMMTIGWGTLGILWGEPVATVYVRHSRYTYKFMENEDFFTVSAYPKKYRKILNMIGSKSGRDIDKMNIDDWTPVFKHHSVYFEEAKVVLVCKKIYQQDMEPAQVPANYKQRFYPNDDYHMIYTGLINTVLINE